ncbi:SPOR domain-containing protein [Thalassococcus profundi]|uniref:SPOR domain-containing protein n=1 Tax=Thalassococcus profundi TaxID=2282382 RepID=A0A369TRV0_9RHOB|nr:SPOR domain-containing protein [Thalassococcus profundi]RDD67165.1 SPOR domain-containing protein [Thalassococcus profundi]
MSRDFGTARQHGWTVRGVAFFIGLATLSACEDGNLPGFLQPRDRDAAASEPASRAARTVERDIEAPEVFQATEAGLWDGRPSLGGVWAAHPDVQDPERVIIRNEQNGQFVIGALFRRERETPGPRLQISSDAAAALGMLAGQPTNLNVVALRREEATEDAPAEAPAPDGTTGTLAAPTDISSGTLDPASVGAAAAIEAAPETPSASAAPAPTPVAAAPKPPASAPAASALSRPYLQIGIFSVEANANNTATAMRQAGMVPTVKKQSSSGKTFWRVLVGPAQTESERDTLLAKIKSSGFTDAYAVSD